MEGKNKRIKLLIVGISGTCGGIETLFYSLFSKRSELFNIDFVTFSEKCAFEEIYINNGYKVYHLLPRSRNFIKFNKRIKEFFKKHNDYDYIWINTASTSMYQFQYYGKTYTNAKVITHSHGTQSEEKSRFRAFVNMTLALLNKKKVLHNTDLFFCCSIAAGIALFGEKYKDKLIVVRNGVDISKFSFDKLARKEIRTEMEVREEENLIGVVGRLSLQKNPLRAVEILEACLKKDSGFKVLFVGKGDLENKLREYVKQRGLENKVIFSGFREDVNKIYSALDVLLMPSLFEGLPLTAVEAQVSGLPCVLSSSITEETAINSNVKFYGLEQGDEIWARGIVESISYPENRESYAEKFNGSDYNIVNVKKFIEEVLA